MDVAGLEMTAKLQTIALRKQYPGTVALDDVSVSFAGGRVHALLGKNGAGKSTLVKILAGSVQPTSGQILIDGRKVALDSPTDAFRKGIATVYQELSLIPDLSVAENILLGRMPMKHTLGIRRIDWPTALRNAQAVLDRMHAGIDARGKVSALSVAHRQVVEIAKAMSFEPAVLMLDEPTSALSQQETEQLFRIVKRLASSGVAVLYITHRLQELAHVADTVTVLRDGRLIAQADFASCDPQTIVRMMFGQIEQKIRPAGQPSVSQPLMSITRLNRGGRVRDVSFALGRGEILGIAGTLGSGRTELLRTIFGADRADSGSVMLNGRILRVGDPAAARDAGLAFVPEDRKEQGLVLSMGTRPNLFLASLNRMANRGVCNASRERSVARSLVQRLQIKLDNIDSPVSLLSGGNQQKVVLGKWLNTEPRVILFDEPTRGIDVAAKQQVFQIIWNLSSQGIGCVVVSSESQELLELCHRILILKNGRVTDEVMPDATSPEDLWLRCMSA